jgi:hypothetical protein
MGSSLAGVELNRQQELYLCDRDITNPGIRIYDTLTDTLITRIGVGVPPFDLAFLQTPHVGVDGDPVGPVMDTFVLHQNSPNPFHCSTLITFSVPIQAQPDPVRLDVYDALGRLVLTLLDERRSTGNHSVMWDGKDRFGRPAATGVYFYLLRSRSLVSANRMILLR